ncbi:MAG: hypothetical protein KatS3mg110_2251 [Pirellulaceae bacterium]|nr:MAG: hypothetical protein KatS3mg110_2251 [Pirellulaceae bacterium]
MTQRSTSHSGKFSLAVPARRLSLARAGRVLRTVVLVATVLIYLGLFFAGGGKRAEIYALLWRSYLFLPDQLAIDLFQMWCGGEPAEATIVDRLPVLAVALVWSCAAWAAGDWILDRLRLPMAGWQKVVYSWGIGLQLCSLYTLAVGLAGLLHQSWLFWGPSLLTIAAAVWRHRRQLSRENVMRVPPSGRQWLGWLAILPPLVLLLLLAPLPPWEFDVREYHLQVPKEWYQQGFIGFLPHNVYGNMPMGAEMQALAAMALWGGPDGWWYGALAGKVMIGLYALLGALGIAAVLDWLGHPRAGCWAAAIYLSTPWILHVSTVGLVEGAVAAYGILAAGAVGQAIAGPLLVDTSGTTAPNRHSQARRQLFSDESLRWLALAGFLAGAAASCKYTGLLFVAAPMTLIILLSRRLHAKGAMIFVLVCLAGVGPWLLKNYYFTGNPTYPLLYEIFGGQYWDEATNKRWVRAHGPPLDAHGHRFHWHQLRDALRDIGWESDKLSPLLWSLALVGFLQPHDVRWRRMLIGLTVAYFGAWWLFTHRYDRFFVPCFAWIAVWSGIGASAPAAGSTWKKGIQSLVIMGILLNCLVVSTGALTGDNRMLVPLEKLRRDEPQLRRTHPAHLFLNDHVKKNETAVIEGDAQVFDLEVPIYYHTCWNPSWWELWTKNKSLEEQRDLLRRHRVKYVFFHWSEIARYRQPGNYGFTDYITRRRIHDDFVRPGLLRFVPVPSGEGWLDPRSGELYEVVYAHDQAKSEANPATGDGR